jgi:hypothetical protein
MENPSERLERREMSGCSGTTGRSYTDPGAGDDERRLALLRVAVFLSRRLGTLRWSSSGAVGISHSLTNGHSGQPPGAMIKPSTHLQVMINCHRDDWP